MNGLLLFLEGKQVQLQPQDVIRVSDQFGSITISRGMYGEKFRFLNPDGPDSYTLFAQYARGIGQTIRALLQLMGLGCASAGEVHEYVVTPADGSFLLFGRGSRIELAAGDTIRVDANYNVSILHDGFWCYFHCWGGPREVRWLLGAGSGWTTSEEVRLEALLSKNIAFTGKRVRFRNFSQCRWEFEVVDAEVVEAA